MKDRIVKIIMYNKLTHVAFAQRLGVQPSSVTHILNGRNKPSLDFIIKIINAFPEISIEWLLLGKGNMLKSDFLDQNENQSNTNKNIKNELVSEVLKSDLFSEQSFDNNSLISNDLVIAENESKLNLVKENNDTEDKTLFQTDKNDIKKSLSKDNYQKKEIPDDFINENTTEIDKNIPKEKKLQKPIHILLIFEDETYDFLSLRKD